MPRPIKSLTPLRQVRDALTAVEGRVVSQAMFAKRLNVSPSYVNSIEAGSKTMSETLAWRISDMYGIDPTSLLPPGDPRNLGPYLLRTVPYAGAEHLRCSTLEEGIRAWTDEKLFNARIRAAAEEFENVTLRQLRALMSAATHDRKATFLRARIDHAIGEWVAEFRLGKTFRKRWKESIKDLPRTFDLAIEEEWILSLDPSEDQKKKEAAAAELMKEWREGAMREEKSSIKETGEARHPGRASNLEVRRAPTPLPIPANRIRKSASKPVTKRKKSGKA